MRAVLEAAVALGTGAERAALGLVLETLGSTYVGAGDCALFDRDGSAIGWLSGGCLEAEIAVHALRAIESGQIEWLQIDTRDDDELLAPSAVGCRGRLRIALIPLIALTAWPEMVRDWRAGYGGIELTVAREGGVQARVGERCASWRLPAAECGWSEAAADAIWSVRIAPPGRILVLGAGPETALLLPLLRALGWISSVIDSRPRWCGLLSPADEILDASDLQRIARLRFDAALVMHHHFEMDRAALTALSRSDIGFIGLLGPVQRRKDLFAVLSAVVRERLDWRLRSPVGLDLGGRGPEAIVLSICAQLQSYRGAGVGAERSHHTCRSEAQARWA